MPDHQELQIQCRHCGNLTTVPVFMAGEEISCSECGGILQVPDEPPAGNRASSRERGRQLSPVAELSTRLAKAVTGVAIVIGIIQVLTGLVIDNQLWAYLSAGSVKVFHGSVALAVLQYLDALIRRC